MIQTNNIPDYTSLARALVELFGSSVKIVQTDRVSGGDINKAYGLYLNTGDKIFMKANAKENAAFFTAEAAGLNAIKSTGAISTPEILCTGTDDGEDVGYSFLLLKFIKSGGKKADYWETLGTELAAMHKANTSAFIKRGNDKTDSKSDKKSTQSKDNTKAPTNNKFGFFLDNFVGARAQKNTPSSSWIDFYRDYRLAPQFRDADSYFSSEDRKKITKLLDNLDHFLIEPAYPSLLHGDLWSGNVMCGPDGKAMLIDPACYVGNREADIAMTELFGGFGQEFYEAYKKAAPLEPGYEERRDLYNLYQLLNHLNIFGSGYLGPVLSIVSEYV